jgi:galactokinase
MNQMTLTKNNLNTIQIVAPARICLFGDHQDYLGLPVIACAIDKHITLTALKNNSKKLKINLPDIQSERSIDISEPFEILEKGDHFASAIRVIKRQGAIINTGYNITMSGNIPINAGVSSSSAVLVAWIHFLLKAFAVDHKITPEFISQLAYEAEVLEHHSPGGKMDQYTIGIGNIVFIETGDRFNYELIGETLDGMVLGESGIAKDTIGLLGSTKSNAIKAIQIIQDKEANFVLEKASIKDYEYYKTLLPDALKPYFYAAIQNHNITQKALATLKETIVNYPLIGDLINQHHRILRDDLKLTVPKIDAMIDAAIEAGAYGAKIIGSGGGGCIVALCPSHLQDKISIAIKKAGAKDAYPVCVAKGTQIIIDA